MKKLILDLPNISLKEKTWCQQLGFPGHALARELSDEGVHLCDCPLNSCKLTDHQSHNTNQKEYNND
jgi:hypothetical protein